VPGNAPSPIAVSTLDTRYLGIAGTASAFVVQGDGGAVLVECGCAVAFDGLVGQLAALGLAPRDLAALFVTHIHLDHAGSAGHFAREGVPVFVHPRGVRHLAEPSRLIAGSRAVHGPRYDRFYGDPLPIAAGRLHAVEHGGVVEAAGLRFEAVETPGHARHHHAWLVGHAGERAELVFTGDVLAMVSPGSSHISIPVPPSDIDIPAWRVSVERLRALPRDLRAVLTHGGERPLGPHLDAFVARMNEELPLLAELVELASRDPMAADARYRDFLAPRARTAGVGEEMIAALLGKAFRGMNLAGIAEAMAAGRFLPSL
jgi:glyoxylase-like metal-dependent hydrolase (beta-lactamase superfamily II)